MGDITVTDSDHPSHLVEELVALRSDGEFFDYVIKGTNESFHVHSLVLALVSPMFRAMLRTKMCESAKKEAKFPSIPDNIIAKIIDYACNGTCSFSRVHLMDLVKAADYLQMSKLLRMCEEKIPTVLRPTNCFEWQQLVDKLRLATIMPKVQKMMQTSYNKILMTTDFKQLDKPRLLQYLIDLHEQGTCCDDLLNGALILVKHDADNRMAYMEDLLTVVHISKCSDSFLSKTMDDYAELLNKQQRAHNLMMSEVLRRMKPKSLGEVKTIIIGGGQFSSYAPSPTCWILQNDEMVKFSEVPANADFRLNHGYSTCEIPAGMIMTGGNNSELCVIFVHSMNMWVKQQPLLQVRSYHASCFSNGKVFLMGGMASSRERISSVEFMDLQRKTWQAGPSLPQAEILLKVICFKSTIYVLYSASKRFYELDGDTMSWLPKAQIPASSLGCSLAASDDKIFAAGGNQNINYVYTPATDVWCRLTGPSLPERLGALVCYHQKLYLFSGCKRDNTVTDVEEYDIGTDKWSLTKWKLPAPMWNFSAFLVPK